MHTEETQECHTLTLTDSLTYGSGRLLSLFSPGPIPTFGLSLISSIGTTRHFCLSNTTGKMQGRRMSHINLSGIKWTGRFAIHIISTGQSTSLSFRSLFSVEL